MNYIGPDYWKEDTSFNWDGTEYIYNGWAYAVLLEWDENKNPAPEVDEIQVTIRVDSELSAPLQFEIDGVGVGELPNQTPHGTYVMTLEVASGTFTELRFYFGYSAYSVTAIEFGSSQFWTAFKNQIEI